MPNVSKPPDTLQKGQACYKSGNLVEASHYFKTVARSCSCQVGKPNLECACIDFLAACKNRTLDDALRTSCKCPRRAQKRCKDESHLTALGNLVMVAVKAKDYKLGLIYAQNLIYLAPRDPRGYLRVGQILRLMERQHTALAVYQQGTGLVTRADSGHPGLRALQEQEKITGKLITQVDPLEALPAEILVSILGFLKTRQHCLCLRLSKPWKAFMQSQVARPLWTLQHFDRAAKTSAKPKIVKPNMVQKYLARYPSGQLKSLRIDDCAAIPLMLIKFPSVMRVCPQLQHLSLGGRIIINPDALPSPEKMPKLKSLHLDDQINIHIDILDCLINASCETLEALNVFNIPYRNGGSTIWRRLPKLHTLRLAGCNPRKLVDMGHIVDVTPNVETVSLDGMDCFQSMVLVDPEVPRWTNLRRLVLGPEVVIREDMHFPRPTKNIEELVLNENALIKVLGSRSEEPAEEDVQIFDYSGTGRSWKMPIYEFPLLERVVLNCRRKCLDGYPGINQEDMSLPSIPTWWYLADLSFNNTDSLSHLALRSLLWSAVENDTLRHLDLRPFPWAHLGPRGAIKEWGGKDATGITALGINCLIGEVGRHIDNADDALLHAVRLFPKLQDLDIGAETVSPHTLGRILESGVNNIYHTQGASMLELKGLARLKGKDVIQGAYYNISLDSYN